MIIELMQKLQHHKSKGQSLSFETPKNFRQSIFLSKDRLNFIKRRKQRSQQSPDGSPKHYIPAKVSYSQDITNIKAQINKMRTQSPQIIIRDKQRQRNYSVFLQKSKKKDDLAKIVLDRLKRIKSKEYMVKIKRNQVHLPRLDMEGKSCWEIKGKNRPRRIQNDEDQIECVVHKGLKKKDRLKQRYMDLEKSSNEHPNQSLRNQSLSAWKKGAKHQEEEQDSFSKE